MKFSGLLFSVAIAAAAPAFVLEENLNSSTTEISFSWDATWNQDFEIHKSCNLTQRNQLVQAFTETKLLAQHAKEHTLRFGNLSKFYRKYFGDAPSGEVVGLYENVISANKTGVLFRCDNIDGNCDLDGYAGHWRGSNGTDETVICDLSYTSRLFLSQVCSRGYTVAGSKNTVFWAGDLLHRIWHTDKIGQGVVGHYADTYNEGVDLGGRRITKDIRNSASLRYYAMDVYAYDIAVPGKGCTGKAPKDTTSTSQASAASETASETATKSKETGSDHGSECHTHANGETHCV